MLKPAAVLDGRVIGTWRRTLERNAVAITIQAFTPLNKSGRDALARAADRYAGFLGLTPSLVVR